MESTPEQASDKFAFGPSDPQVLGFRVSGFGFRVREVSRRCTILHSKIMFSWCIWLVGLTQVVSLLIPCAIAKLLQWMPRRGRLDEPLLLRQEESSAQADAAPVVEPPTKEVGLVEFLGLRGRADMQCPDGLRAAPSLTYLEVCVLISV